MDSDDSTEETNEKERHSSGESIDSAVCFSTPTSPTKSESPHRFLVIPSDFGQKSDCNLRGILRRTRGYSETNVDFLRMASPAESENSTIAEEDTEVKPKKSVRFNEVVQRQVRSLKKSLKLCFFCGDLESDEKTRQNAENKQTFDLMAKIEISEKNLSKR